MNISVLGRVIVLVLLSILVVGCITQHEESKVAIELIGSKKTLKLTLNQIKSLKDVKGIGGLITSTGKIKGPYAYRGVPLVEIAKLVNVPSNYCLKVIAKDGYQMLFTKDQLEGKGFVAYDPKTGKETTPKGEFTVILAYEENGKELDEDNLKIAILNPEGLITEGHYWVKWVKKIVVLSTFEKVNLTLKGAINVTLSTDDIQSGMSCHGIDWKDEQGQIWTGVPLWRFVGYVDDENKHGKGAFNDKLVGKYKVKLIASDGYSVVFDSKDIARNDNIILAFQLNKASLPKKFWPATLVGEIPKQKWIRNVVEIDLIFEG